MRNRHDAEQSSIGFGSVLSVWVSLDYASLLPLVAICLDRLSSNSCSLDNYPELGSVRSSHGFFYRNALILIDVCIRGTRGSLYMLLQVLKAISVLHILLLGTDCREYMRWHELLVSGTRPVAF